MGIGGVPGIGIGMGMGMTSTAGTNPTNSSKAPEFDSNIVYYQLLHQIWRKKPTTREQRSLVLTPSVALLGEETLETIDVTFTVHAAVPLASVQNVRQESNPLQVTFVFKNQAGLGVILGRKKWRLVLSSPSMASKLVEECRKLGLPTKVKD